MLIKTKHKLTVNHGKKGTVLLFTLMVMVVLSSVVGAYLGFVQSSTRSTGAQIEDSQAIYLADAGLSQAIWYLMNTAPDGSGDYSWRTTTYPAVPGPNSTDPRQKSFGNGTFTIWVQDSNSGVQIYARGTVGELTRIITQTMVTTSKVLERAVHADASHLKLNNSSGTINGNISCFISVLPDPLPAGLTITGDVVQGEDQVKVNPELVLDSYYTLAAAAGQVVASKTFANATYTGIWYVTNKATIGDNARIEGSIIAKTIIFDYAADNVLIDPTLYDPTHNYPALYAWNDITSTGTGGNKIGLQNSTINGLVLAKQNITFDWLLNTTFNGTILAGQNIDMQNGSGFIVNYNEDIFTPMPSGFSFSGGEETLMPQKDWDEI